MFCENCEALEETCCQAAKARRETNNRLANLIERMSDAMAKMRTERDAARLAFREVMELHRVAE